MLSIVWVVLNSTYIESVQLTDESESAALLRLVHAPATMESATLLMTALATTIVWGPPGERVIMVRPYLLSLS